MKFNLDRIHNNKYYFDISKMPGIVIIVQNVIQRNGMDTDIEWLSVIELLELEEQNVRVDIMLPDTIYRKHRTRRRGKRIHKRTRRRVANRVSRKLSKRARQNQEVINKVYSEMKAHDQQKRQKDAEFKAFENELPERENQRKHAEAIADARWNNTNNNESSDTNNQNNSSDNEYVNMNNRHIRNANIREAQQESISDINKDRESLGESDLQEDPQLDHVAQVRAKQIMHNFTH